MTDILIRGMDIPMPGVYTCELGVLDANTAILTIYTPICESQKSYKFIPLPEGHGKLVRCGECMFWDAPPSCEGLARCQTGESGVRFRKAYDFCSRGCKKDERRSDDG